MTASQSSSTALYVIGYDSWVGRGAAAAAAARRRQVERSTVAEHSHTHNNKSFTTMRQSMPRLPACRSPFIPRLSIPPLPDLPLLLLYSNPIPAIAPKLVPNEVYNNLFHQTYYSLWRWSSWLTFLFFSFLFFFLFYSSLIYSVCWIVTAHRVIASIRRATVRVHYAAKEQVSPVRHTT